MREISASFLGDNPKNTIDLFNNSPVDYIHFDVMDGKFTKNKSLSVGELCKMLDLSKKKNDVHLMVNDPSNYIDKLALYDISYLTIHYEIKDFDKMLEKIKSLGIKCGVAICPETDISKIYHILKSVDLVLVMSVNPGSSGQSFIPSSTDKINNLKNEINKQELNTKIEVDGGINETTISNVLNADIVVSGSFLQKDIKNIELLK